MNITIETSDAGQRLDLFLAGQGLQSRAAWQRAIKAGQVQVNGAIVKTGYILRTGDQITGQAPAAARVPTAVPAAVSIPILYEDADVVVIDKPAGVEVHPGQVPGQPTVTAWLLGRVPAVAGLGDDPLRPGVVHRLDKETSGVLILAKTPRAWTQLKRQFQHRNVQKQYSALVFGVPGGTDGRIAQPLSRSPRNPLRRMVDPEGKPAVTEWRITEKFSDRFALLDLSPLTGRTHQLRAHLHWFGYPIVGDRLYTFKRQRPPAGVARHLLHARELTVRLPKGSRQTFAAPLPPDFTAVLDELRASL